MQRRTRCRAIVIWTVVSFVVIQWAMGTIIDVALPHVRDPEYSYREKLLQEQIARDPQMPLVVVMGSSRILNGLDAGTATKMLEGEALVFNFGIPSSGPCLEAICFERLRSAGIKPEVLVVEILPAFLNGRKQPLDQCSMDGARLSASELNRVSLSLETMTGPVRRWMSARLLPSYRHQAELRNLLGIDENRQGIELPEELRTLDAFGWQPRRYPPERRPALVGLAHRQYDACYRDFQLSSEQIMQLEHLLERCQREGIRVALVLSPEGSEFRALYTPQMTKALDELFERLRVRFGIGIIDARDWIDDEHFADMHHLMDDGAREFSRKLALVAIKPILRSTDAHARRP